MADVQTVEFIDRPFAPPLPRMVEVHLPKPPSTNRLWAPKANSKSRYSVRLSPEYQAWKIQADLAVMVAGVLRGFRRIEHAFEVRIVIEPGGRGDLDNRIKSLLDWAQSRQIIANDKNCQRIICEYGEAPKGCRLIIKELA